MNIKANMRVVDFDSIKNTSTVATGWVEIEGIFKIPVSVRKWLDDKSGKEMMFVSYPQRKDGDKYSGVVYPHDREVRNEIDRVVLEVTKEKLFAESVPDVNIDDVRITPLNQKTDSVVQKLGIASVKMYGMTVNGIVIKEGRKGRFVQMPQYQTQGQYRDTVYGVTAAIQRKIEERVLLEYDRIIRAQEEVNMQEVQETKNNQEIEQADIVMGKIIDVPSLNAYPDMRDNETVKAAIEKLIEAYPESLVLSPTEDDVMQTLELAGVAADRKRLDGIYSGTEDREEYLQYLKSLREDYTKNDTDEIKMSYLDKAITYVGQIRKPKTSQDENKGIDAEDAAEIQEDEEPMYSSADVITLMPNFFAEKNRDGVRFTIKNTKLNIDNPIIVGKYIRAQCFTVENGNDKVFARFQNELNGMEHMRTGPLLIRQQIVMQVFKDGVPQPPYLYASYKSDNVTEAIEHYNECKGWWTDLTGQTTAEIFQRAKTMENKQDVKQNKLGL